MRGNVAEIDRLIPQGLCSPYAACGLAYRLGATAIVIHGVDLTGHHFLGQPWAMKDQVQQFKNLAAALKIKGCDLYVSSWRSALAGHIPVAH